MSYRLFTQDFSGEAQHEVREPTESKEERRREAPIHSSLVPGVSVPLDTSALGSVSLSLEDLLNRLRELATETHEDDEIGSELREVERQLDMASRRLQKALRRL